MPKPKKPPQKRPKTDAILSPKKCAQAFRTITEVAAWLEIPLYVLRFWEREFDDLRPLRRSGRRYYRPEDLALVRRIHGLIYLEGYTIKGVQRVLANKPR
jgi:DNA-binding transcriptional MerR regulator